MHSVIWLIGLYFYVYIVQPIQEVINGFITL